MVLSGNPGLSGNPTADVNVIWIFFIETHDHYVHGRSRTGTDGTPLETRTDSVSGQFIVPPANYLQEHTCKPSNREIGTHCPLRPERRGSQRNVPPHPLGRWSRLHPRLPPRLGGRCPPISGARSSRCVCVGPGAHCIPTHCGLLIGLRLRMGSWRPQLCRFCAAIAGVGLFPF